MTFLSGIWARVAGVAAIVGAVLLAILRIRADGRAAERAEQAQRDADHIRMAENAGRIVDSSSDAELQRLRAKWTAKR